MLKKLLGSVFILALALFFHASTANAASTISGNSLTIDNTGGTATQVGIDLQPAVAASAGNGYGMRLQQTLTASAGSDVINGMYVNPTFSDNGMASVTHSGSTINSSFSGALDGFSGLLGQRVFATSTGSASSFGAVLGLQVRASFSGTGTLNALSGQENNAFILGGAVTNTYGIYNTVFQNAGTTTNVYGIFAPLTANGGSMSNANGVTIQLRKGSSGTITTAKALDISGWTTAGTPATTSYGIYMDTSLDAFATTHYALYSSATSQSYLQGNLGIGTATPGAKLDVTGHIASSGAAPTPSVTGSGYSGASVGAGSTDTRGSISATVGAAAGTLVVTFNSAYTTAPYCTVTPGTATAQVDSGKMYATTATGALTLNFVATPTGGSETWTYHCIQ